MPPFNIEYQMNLKEIVSIAGVSGLNKIIGRTKTGLILESMNEPKKRFATGIQDKVSVLEDISMYTVDGDMRLAEVLVKLNERGDVPSQKEDAATLRKFLVETINLDSERVYDSDIKKLINWFHVLKQILDFSTLLTETEDAEGAEKPAADLAVDTEVKIKAPKAPKTSTPKTSAPPKANTKGVAGSKNTYRPKSV